MNRAQKIAEHARAMSNALLKIRPLGGSEMFVRVDAEFYADAAYCGELIEQLRSDLHEARVEIATLRKAGATP